MTNLNVALKASVAAFALSATSAMAEDVEVLHWWTSGGEAAALNVLKEDLEGQGIGWQDMPVGVGREVLSASPASMITVAVRDDGTFHRQPWIDIKVPCLTIEASRCRFDEFGK